MTDLNCKRTPLYQNHIQLGGKMVPFAGWEMPVQYSGVIAEHVAVRTAAGLFDVSHMGEIFVTGPEALAAINYLTTNDVSKLYDGKAQYSAIANEKGGVVDDIIVYRYSADKYLICVNASNADKDFAWFSAHNKHKAVFTNKSADFGQVAIQGPKAKNIIARCKGLEKAGELKYFHFADMNFDGVPVIVARTGYTGEDGFEIFVPAKSTGLVWDRLLEIGKPDGLIPAGLGARDSLRLEACYPLHGHELGEDISAIESGLGWVTKFDKGDFIGRSVLEAHKKAGAPRALVGFFVDAPGIVREGTELFSVDGAPIGKVTSGTKTPTINRSLGMALIKREFAGEGNKFCADVRGKKLECHVSKIPFYKKPA